MSKTEDYLDSLLNSVSSGKAGTTEGRRRRRMSMAYAEEFERELNDADMEAFIQEFEREIDEEEDEVLDVGDGDSFFDNLEGIVQNAKEKELQKKKEDEVFEINTLDDDTWTEPEEDTSVDAVSAMDMEVNTMDAAESEDSDETVDLLDMLAGLADDEELSVVSQETNPETEDFESFQEDIPEDEGASFDLSELEDTVSETKPTEKVGLVKKLSRILFGDDDENSEVSVEAEGADVIEVSVDEFEADEYQNMSEEELQILRELKSTEAVNKPKEHKKVKKTKEEKQAEKKAAKEQKKQEKKAKKEKAKEAKKLKEKKPKKVKKPKEVDLTPPLPGKPVFLIFLMAVSIFVLVLLASELIGYTTSMNTAKYAYAKQDYVEACEALSGLELKEEDVEYYDKVLLLAIVQEEYDAGEVLYSMGEYTKSLDSYICALGRYNANYEEALTYEVDKEYDAMAGKILKKLEENFKVSGEEAKELYALYDREEYSCRIYDIVKALGLVESEEE